MCDDVVEWKEYMVFAGEEDILLGGWDASRVGAIFGVAAAMGEREIQGSLHCATDGEAACCFGRDDVVLGLR
jgi:hypothetical protein